MAAILMVISIVMVETYIPTNKETITAYLALVHAIQILGTVFTPSTIRANVIPDGVFRATASGCDAVLSITAI